LHDAALFTEVTRNAGDESDQLNRYVN